MTHEQNVQLARALLGAVMEQFPALEFWPQTVAQMLGTLWHEALELGVSDAEFFRQYASVAGLITLGGCAMRAVEVTLAPDHWCPECGGPMQTIQ